MAGAGVSARGAGHGGHGGRGRGGRRAAYGRPLVGRDTPGVDARCPPRRCATTAGRSGPEGKAECTLSLLSGIAGGLDANVNRWRKQMSLPPASARDSPALPKLTWLGVDARDVTLDGDYRGMGQAGAGAGGAACWVASRCCPRARPS